MLTWLRYIDYRSVVAVSISASWRHRLATAFDDWVTGIDTRSRKARDLRVLVRTLLHDVWY